MMTAKVRNNSRQHAIISSRSLIHGEVPGVETTLQASTVTVYKPILPVAHEDSGYHPENFVNMMTRICYFVALVSTVIHLGVVLRKRKLRQLYGRYHLTVSTSNLLANMCLFISSCSTKQTLHCYVVSVLAHFLIVVYSGWVAAACSNVWRAVRRVGVNGARIPLVQVDRHCAQRYLRCSALVYGVSAVVTGAGVATNRFAASIPQLAVLNPTYGEHMCGIAPLIGYILLFYCPICVSSCFQLIFIGLTINMSRGRSSERRLVAKKEVNCVRLSLCGKYSVSALIVWLTGLLASLIQNAMLWHSFTIFLALQSIFVAVTSIFSRPVITILSREPIISKCADEPKDIESRF